MNIRVDLNTPILDGTEVVFRSPVDCSQITGLIVYYKVGGNTASKEFAFADAHGNNVGDIDHLFAENVAVKVILDVTTGMAFVQNADTNAYLEGRFAECANALKGTASGEVVVLKDISPLVREIAVTLTSDSLDDFEGIVVLRYGEDYAVNKTIALATATSAGSLTMANGGLKEPLKAGHTYTIFADITSDAEDKRFRVDKQDFGVLGYFKGEGRQALTIIIGESDCDYVRFYSAVDNATSKTVATTYENITIVEETDRLDRNADTSGNVKGVMSLYPTTTLIADSGVKITVEYNRDTNKVIESLVQAIVSLGGNV